MKGDASEGQCYALGSEGTEADPPFTGKAIAFTKGTETFGTFGSTFNCL